MTALGEHAGFECFWADPSQSEGPGLYVEEAGRKRKIWEPQFDTAGATVQSVKAIPWEPGSQGLAVEMSNGIGGAFRVPTDMGS